ncbi:MAG: hypothetical protein IT305_03600 [Chloroflexi bacterium]|nr:hypothetical protein [Chloroflexota bacterium]
MIRRLSGWLIQTGLCAVLSFNFAGFPPGGDAPSVRAAEQTTTESVCALGPEIAADSCRLTADAPSDGRLDQTDGRATYRLDVLRAPASLTVSLDGGSSTGRVQVLDWTGHTLAEARRNEGEAAVLTTTAAISLPGVYGIVVAANADAPDLDAAYRLHTSIAADPAAGALATVIWPSDGHDASGPQARREERQVLRSRIGGVPERGVALARALGTPETIASDFTLISDVAFETIAGPAALTVRFRYEPERGGGTGYILSVNPFVGEASLDAFDEGRRQPIVAHAPLPGDFKVSTARRLVVRAVGPAIDVSLDGQSVLAVEDDRYAQGIVTVGTVTWSDPVAVTFDHLLLIGP